jgi:hypothetical protein
MLDCPNECKVCGTGIFDAGFLCMKCDYHREALLPAKSEDLAWQNTVSWNRTDVRTQQELCSTCKSIGAFVCFCARRAFLKAGEEEAERFEK